MQRTSWIAAISCLAALLPMGCSAYRSPAATIASAHVQERGEEAMAVHFAIELTNSNQVSIELVQFKYDVEIDGRKVYSGVRAAQATLAANGQRRMIIPAVLRFDRLGWSPQSFPPQAEYEISGTLQYITPGEIAQILFDTGVRKPKAGFTSSGQLVFEQPPAN
jgi:hypothetical protein